MLFCNRPTTTRSVTFVPSAAVIGYVEPDAVEVQAVEGRGFIHDAGNFGGVGCITQGTPSLGLRSDQGIFLLLRELRRGMLPDHQKPPWAMAPPQKRRPTARLPRLIEISSNSRCRRLRCAARSRRPPPAIHRRAIARRRAYLLRDRIRVRRVRRACSSLGKSADPFRRRAKNRRRRCATAPDSLGGSSRNALIETIRKLAAAIRPIVSVLRSGRRAALRIASRHKVPARRNRPDASRCAADPRRTPSPRAALRSRCRRRRRLVLRR